MRGGRFCEIIVAERSGFSIASDIYSSAWLDDCAPVRWDALDAGRLADELGATRVILKGPRYWTADDLDGPPTLLDATPRVIGGITVRHASSLEFSVFDVGEVSRPYRLITVPAGSAWVFAAGRRVYELIGSDDTVYTMLSFSTQKAPLDEAALPELATRLRLPAGWRYRSTVLGAELRTATRGDLRVIQDELDNVYVSTRRDTKR